MFTLSSTTRIVALALAIATTAQAQTQTRQSAPTPTRNWELRLPSGGLFATGAQRDQLKDAQLTGLQISRSISSHLAITGTFAWAASRDLATTDRQKLDVFTSDLGVEGRSREFFASAPISLSTFAGLGAGARSYNYRKLDVDATNNLAGYAAAGAELGMRRFGLRLEARNYATGFKPLIGAGKSEARNDVVVMATFRFNRRSPSPVVEMKREPTIAIESPAAGDTVRGVTIVRFRTANIVMASPFGPQPVGSLPAGHVHVTVDGTSWHWMHTSTDPIVITPMSVGEHTVTLELADANHRPITSQTVRFMVRGK
jgi:hypothetical protein